jgi:hypothetical protein
MSSMVACESGTSAAPNIPWKRRNVTISSSDWAAPHSMEVMVKPIRQVTNRYLRPNRLASQPTGAVMMAAAVM